MKLSIVLLLSALQIIGYLGCKKETGETSRGSNIQNWKDNTAPTANAGSDLLLKLPTNEVILPGTYSDAENNVSELTWEKISGPDSFQLNSKILPQPKLSRLVEGEYQFELTVTDLFSLYDKDTIKIIVQANVFNNEIIFKDQLWTFPWYASIEISNFYTHVPRNTPFRIFIKRDGMSGWLEAKLGEPYEFFVETRPDGAGIYNYGSLYIFYHGMDTNDTPDIRIIY